MLFINNRIAIYRQKMFISYDDICDHDIIAKPILGDLFLSTTRIPIVEYHGLYDENMSSEILFLIVNRKQTKIICLYTIYVCCQYFMYKPIGILDMLIIHFNV